MMRQRPITFVLRDVRTTNFKMTKYLLVAAVLANVANTVWIGFYLNGVVDDVQADYDAAHLDKYGTLDGNVQKGALMWKWISLAFLAAVNLLNLLALVAAVKEYYWLNIVLGLLMSAIAVFAAALDYTRKSITAWLLPYFVAVCAFLFAHRIRTDILSFDVYSAPPSL